MLLDAIPVFKPNQALTADHLNDLREFLDQQDRLTRRALIGIGVMCGFELDVDAQSRVRIGKGVAVTSEGHLITDQAVVCDRFRPYQQPLPQGNDVTPQMLADARYPYLFPNGANQIPAWEMLATGVQVAAGEPQPTALSQAFLADKCVMLFLECTEEALRNCSINDCSDKGAELQFTLRRLLVNRADADAMLTAEAQLAGRPVDPASHPGLGLPYLRVEDLGLARLGVDTFPALIARILQIAGRYSTDLPQALTGAWDAYGYLMQDMYPPAQYPNGPFPQDYFGNVWGNLFTEPYLVQYFYDYLLDAAAAYNEFVAAARAFHAECLPAPGRFPKHVLLGDPRPAAIGFVAEVANPVEFAAYDPFAASSGFGPRPNPPRRRTPWTPADKPAELADLRALFHRLTLLAHAYQLRGMLNAEIRVTPSRHDAWPLADRAIPPYYAVNHQSDLYRVWSPAKTRANLLSTVYAYPFSQRTADHPYLYRIDGEDFYSIAGHVGKDLSTVMRELIVHKRVLGLDFAIEPVWMGLGLPNDARATAIDQANQGRALQAAMRILLCRMGDVEVILLGLFAALFAFLVYILRGVGKQRVLDHTRPPMMMARPIAADAAPAAAEIAAEDMERLVRLARIDAVRRPAGFDFAAARVTTAEREEINTISTGLLDRFRNERYNKGTAAETIAKTAGADDSSIITLYRDVHPQADNSSLFDRVRGRVAQLDIPADQRQGAADQVYKAISLADATEDLMGLASVRSLQEFDAAAFEASYNTFSDRLTAYAATAPSDAQAYGQETAQTNIAFADYAPAVAAQTTTFSRSGFFGEIGRRVASIFADLTMGGYARKHPGLEHRAGVPKGGTLVLAYASKQEFLTLMRLVAPRLDQLSGALNIGPGNGGLAAVVAPATRDLLAAAGPTREDPLSDFIVLADFCVSSQCCDADCSDIAFEDQLPTDLFDLDQPGRMSVDPIVPNGVPPNGAPPNRPPGGQPRPNDNINDIMRDIGVGVAGRPIARGAERADRVSNPFGGPAPIEPVAGPGEPAPRIPDPARPAPADPAPADPVVTRPERPADVTPERPADVTPRRPATPGAGRPRPGGVDRPVPGGTAEPRPTRPTGPILSRPTTRPFRPGGLQPGGRTFNPIRRPRDRDDG